MEHAMVSVATGVLSPTLGKLSTLLEKKYNSLKGVRDEIISLKDELSSMNALLLKLADIDDLDVQVKEWRNQVRELSYDIEDCIDDFTHRVDRGPSRPDNMKGFFQNSIRKLRTLGARNEIANQISKLKDRVDNASERRKRYNFDGAASSSSGVLPIDPRLPALYEEAQNLVGIDEPREELIKWLTEGEGMSTEKKLKVVSLVGLGGLGKTTLALQVYDKIEGQFDCKAFVSVSQKPDMRKILRKILSDVTGRNILSNVTGRKDYPDIEAYDEEQLINELREFLNDKRYFIVVDDIWSASVWPTIRCALLENNLCSRILTTTRSISVAKSCCFPDYHNVCEMESLSDVNAEKLFFKRIFGSEDHRPSELKEVSSEILRKCGGLPLAIISIASLLADKPCTKEHWGRCLNYIGSALEDVPSVSNMQRILSLSYNDLPHYLKTCLLYLSVYPEDFRVVKCELVWRWMAEGFITAAVGDNLVEVGERYFNELINRSMIIPRDIRYDGQAEAYEVHDMILDLIVSKSIEENFITFGKNIHVLGQQDKVRRLSLDFQDQEDIMMPSTMVFPKARSLHIYGSAKHMPPLSGFQALRVIYIQYNDKLENHYLDDIGRLFRLKYLGLIDVSISKLPDQIGELQQLETLELKTEIKELPKSIVRLKKLMFLRADDVSLPEGIGNMRALRDLYSMKVDNSIGSTSLRDLGSLTELRYLGIHWCVSDTYNDQKSYTDSFVSSISRLCRFKLRRLDLQCDDQNGCSLDFLLDSWSPPPCLLQYFGMYTHYCFPRIPGWVASLSNITYLDININPVGEQVLGILGGLPSLLALVLSTKAVAPKGSLVICSSGFQCLKEFKFGPCNIAMGPLVFEVGAMPKLEKCVFGLVARDIGSPCSDCYLGLQHIPSIKHLCVDIDCTDARAQEVEAIEAFARNLSSLHRRHLRIETNIYETEHMVRDEDNGSMEGSEDHVEISMKYQEEVED